ncbi:hypothetical protein E4T47_05732 [Aureobasidium subglaciale]|nr:hypothetical protein E4T43_02077 [Aureobasidium subglaciale]KAI5270970.1 hypothetical protein E4T47_05732 [Aureobasidium subglaciale]
MESSWAPPGVRTNIDMDPTPLSRRTWTCWTILGYWISDVISIQSWTTGSTILAVGLTWKEAVFSIIVGSTIMAISMTLNGFSSPAIPVYKMKWLFMIKTIMMTMTVVGMLIWICVKAKGSGDLYFELSTVGVNIPDFTRYMSKPRDVLYQGLWFPLVCSWIAIIGIVVTSASKTIYGEYLWNPISIIDMWDGPGWRAAAFSCGVSWLLAQIWAIVPWKILTLASSLLNFMSSLGIFLAPCMGILCSDFFIVKRQMLDVPALHDPQGRYAYSYGTNWRTIVALVAALGPTLPGLIHAVNAKIDIGGAEYVADFN